MKAEAAEVKLHKEGFGENEVFRLASSAVQGGEFREHGPNRNRSEIFLQTRRTGPNPVVVVLLAVIFGLVLGVLLLVAHFAIAAIPEPTAAIAGAVVGVILGAAIGLLRRGQVQGAIGQDLTKTKTTTASPKTSSEARTVIAVRLPDNDNITRKTRARAILLNSGGKIDRSVGRTE
jgi:hypothetical protein